MAWVMPGYWFIRFCFMLDIRHFKYMWGFVKRMMYHFVLSLKKCFCKYPDVFLAFILIPDTPVLVCAQHGEHVTAFCWEPRRRELQAHGQ